MMRKSVILWVENFSLLENGQEILFEQIRMIMNIYAIYSYVHIHVHV